MLEFQLFRMQVYPSMQGDFFEKPKKPEEIIREVILSLSYTPTRTDILWHIGNITEIDTGGLYFRVGRITSATIEVYHDGKFEDTEFEEAPYTHVIVDVPLEICAIAKKPKLSADTAGVARQLIRLLNNSKRAQEIRATLKIDEIYDPTDFLTHLHEAYVISKFWLTFSKPNAFDVNQDFVKPAEKLLQEVKGNEGKIEVKGDSLVSDGLEDLARSAASKGDDAGAWLQLEQEKPKVKRTLKDNPVSVMLEDISDTEQKKSLLKIIREKYRRIRSGD